MISRFRAFAFKCNLYRYNLAYVDEGKSDVWWPYAPTLDTLVGGLYKL